jgi:periplasmic protein TonB
MQSRPPPPDALVSFSDFLLERFGLVATMQVAIIASIAFHSFLIVGLGVKWIRSGGLDEPHNVMDVVLVNSKSAARPDKADALAQVNLDGGGNTDEKLRAKSPFPAVDPRDPSVELKSAENRRKQLEAEAKELMATLKAKLAVAPAEPDKESAAKSGTEARDLIEKSLEMARLEAQIARDQLAYQKRPKRKFFGARVQEYRFAQYIENCRARIEHIGTLNFPPEAKARKLYGALRLTVAIKANGEVESVEINQSSGHKILDQAALRIVRLAAPFDRFPDNIRADTDILHLTRTYYFTTSDQVVAE